MTTPLAPPRGEASAHLDTGTGWSRFFDISLFTGLWLVLGTELLGLFGWLRPVAIWAWWGLWAAGLAAWSVRSWRRSGGLLWGELRQLLTQLRSRPLDGLLIGVLLGLGATSLVQALWSVPGNSDSLVYHLARQVMWEQQGHVGHFPTGSIRLVAMPPLAEFAGLHFRLLLGGVGVDPERLANLVQWLAYVGSTLSCLAVALRLGSGRTGGLIAAVVFALYPMAFLQASNTKNDLVVAFWVLGMAWYALRLLDSGRRETLRWSDALGLGGSLGLAVLTKGTGAVIALPICLLIGALLLWRGRPGILAGLAIGLMTLLPNLGHWSRNLEMFGRPLGPTESRYGGSDDYVVHDPDLSTLGSNLVRNTTLHLSSGDKARNARIETWSRSLITWLGADPDDPRSTWRSKKFDVVWVPANEDSLGSTLHLGLGVVAWLGLGLWPGRRRTRWYWLVPIGAVLSFSWVLAWQPWHARLHIPIVALSAPLIGLWCRRIQTPGAVLLTVVGLWAIVPCVTAGYRPLIGEKSIFERDPEEQRYIVRRGRRAGTVAMAKAIAALETTAGFDVTTVGIHVQRNDWRYPLMAETLKRKPGVRFVETNAYPMTRTGPPEIPDVIVVRKWERVATSGPDAVTAFVPIRSEGDLTLYARPAIAARVGTGGLSRYFGAGHISGVQQLGNQVKAARFHVAFSFGMQRPGTVGIRIRCRPTGRRPISLTLSVDGRQIRRIPVPVGKAFTDVTVPIVVERGTTRISLGGAKGTQFSLLRIEPWFGEPQR